MAAPDKKNRLLLEFGALLQQWRTAPALWWQQLQVKLRNLPQSNFAMGCNFAERDKLRDAIFRFKIAIYMQPKFPAAWYQLGVCQLRNGLRNQAKISLKKALSQQHEYPEAAYILASIDPALVPASQRPTRMPAGMMEGFFNQIATIYDKLEQNNQYHGAMISVDMLRPHLPATSGLQLLDIGCGTGLAAKLWRKVAAKIVGLEVTQAMLAQARITQTADEKILFDELHLADIRQLPPQLLSDSSFDVALLVNVAQFIGDLQNTLQQIAQLLKPDGLLLLTIEPCGGNSYSVMPSTGRFGHSDAYVLACAHSAGLQPLAQQAVALYPNTKASAHVLRKAAL